ncbi:type II toxin-antitoxin system HicB family antitoxin [Gracilinema caldarium]|uniref:Uncharacterized protein family UPF0150 n=1 Tax=Gracilinema caldarium (strain ATCC 51460 / DSM 7334 / H1) TaxID=744872 RepID=F8F459_GRAC1|nr:hypothetical protein [Gracilinema caldarium]AEJ20506.1 Uncharacterized protein family UPF0150 [Gracilinema caldarium DSM 7334]
MKKEINFIIWKEGDLFVAQCLNVDVSTFGSSIEEATNNIKEAVELYFENEQIDIPHISTMLLGSETINA